MAVLHGANASNGGGGSGGCTVSLAAGGSGVGATSSTGGGGGGAVRGGDGGGGSGKGEPQGKRIRTEPPASYRAQPLAAPDGAAALPTTPTTTNACTEASTSVENTPPAVAVGTDDDAEVKARLIEVLAASFRSGSLRKTGERDACGTIHSGGGGGGGASSAASAVAVALPRENEGAAINVAHECRQLAYMEGTAVPSTLQHTLLCALEEAAWPARRQRKALTADHYMTIGAPPDTPILDPTKLSRGARKAAKRFQQYSPIWFAAKEIVESVDPSYKYVN